jgi:hypothetical protein
MKMYWRVEVQHHAFLISALYGGKMSAWRTDRFTPREIVPGTHWIGGGGDEKNSLPLPRIELPMKFPSIA